MDDIAKTASTYDADFHAWALEQAALLRAGRLSELDIENIAEEIEGMARGERRELINRLTVLLVQLLKWRYQPSHRGNSWRLTIREQRARIEEHLGDNPSLKNELQDAIRRAYRFALLGAQKQTGLSEASFPAACPWTASELLTDGFLPD